MVGEGQPINEGQRIDGELWRRGTGGGDEEVHRGAGGRVEDATGDVILSPF